MKLASLFVAFFLASAVAQAAVYDIHFNETEQGAKSTANPQVTTPAAAQAAAVPAAPAAPVAQPIAPVVVAPFALPQTVPEPHYGFRMRAKLAASFVASNLTDGNGSMRTSWSGHFALGVNRFSAFNFGVGLGPYKRNSEYTYYGLAEYELTPIHISFFGHEDAVELGALLGASTLGRTPDNWMSLYVGARFGLNFGDHWATGIDFRVNRGFRAAETTLSYRF